MSDIDKILGIEHIFLNKTQQKLLDQYTSFRNKCKKLDSNEQIQLLSYLDMFYKVLDPHQQKVVTAWLTYEMCNIDNALVTSLKIAEFSAKHHLDKHIALSHDNNSFMFVMDSKEEAEKLQKIFLSQYKNVDTRIEEVK